MELHSFISDVALQSQLKTDLTCTAKLYLPTVMDVFQL